MSDMWDKGPTRVVQGEEGVRAVPVSELDDEEEEHKLAIEKEAREEQRWQSGIARATRISYLGGVIQTADIPDNVKDSCNRYLAELGKRLEWLEEIALRTANESGVGRTREVE